MSNLELWNKVQETNPDDTKAVSFGRKFTAIDAYSQIKKATEQFGPYGIWGLKDMKHRFIEGTTMVLGYADFVYPATFDCNTDKFFNFPITSSIMYISEKGKVDDDFAKKLETDMITKALSRLGFNADVFMGLFDDNRYVQAMKEKHKQISPEPIRLAVIEGAYNAFKEVVDADVDVMDFMRVQDGFKRLTPDEQVALWGKFGSDKPEGCKKGYKAIIKELLQMKEGDE